MFCSIRSLRPSLSMLSLIMFAAVVLVNCGSTANQPSGPTSVYDKAKDAFKSVNVEKALDLTDKLAATTPPADFTDRARVLRAVIYTGELKGALELAEAYGQGVEKSRNVRFQSQYRRLQHDNLENAGKAALNLAETAHQIAPGGVMPKELTLEASYPTTEGPADVKQLVRVKEGGWIEPDEQERAATDALRKGVDDALAEVVAGDRSKARQALAGGSTKLDSAAFALFLAQELVDGATVFDRHHARDPQKLITLCDESDVIVNSALALLKDTPNKDEQAEAKKLQDKFKTIRKDR